MRDHIVIQYESVNSLFKDMKNVKYSLTSAETVGDLTLLNLRVNAIPIVGDCLLLRFDREDDAAKIPSQTVLLPDYMTGNPFETNEKFMQILINNAYLSMVDYNMDDAVEDFHCGNLDLKYLLRDSIALNQLYFCPHFDAQEEFYKGYAAHYVDIFMFMMVKSVTRNGRFVYVPTDLFEIYYKSRNPQVYLDTFSELRVYDEKSPDFRLNPDGRDRIHAAITKWNKLQKKI